MIVLTEEQRQVLAKFSTEELHEEFKLRHDEELKRHDARLTTPIPIPKRERHRKAYLETVKRAFDLRREGLQDSQFGPTLGINKRYAETLSRNFHIISKEIGLPNIPEPSKPRTDPLPSNHWTNPNPSYGKLKWDPVEGWYDPYYVPSKPDIGMVLGLDALNMKAAEARAKREEKEAKKWEELRRKGREG